jgi:hypothetical protein
MLGMSYKSVSQQELTQRRRTEYEATYGVGDETGSVVGRTGEGDSLDAETGRGHLGDQSVASRAKAQLEAEEHEDDQGADGPRDAGTLCRNAQDSNDDQDDKHDGQTIDVHGAAADITCHIPS